MAEFDVICVGDAVVDTFMAVHNASDVLHYDEEKGTVTMHAGAKILVDESCFTLGGNGCNVAVGLSRLGLKTALLAEFGDDEFAAKIQKGLTAEHVSQELVKITSGASSTFSVGLQVQGERTLFIHHEKRTHDLSFKDALTKWIYLTSMGEEWRGMYDRVAAYAKEKQVKIAFNPGSAQMKAGYESFKDIVTLCDILFVNRDEAEEILYGRLRTAEEKESAEDLLFRLSRMGPKMVVFTDGLQGSYCLDTDGKVYSHGIIPVKKQEGKTGAGDAFASGFLAALFYGKTAQEALEWGAYDSSAVLEHIGAQVNLLTKDQLEERIKEKVDTGQQDVVAVQ